VYFDGFFRRLAIYVSASLLFTEELLLLLLHLARARLMSRCHRHCEVNKMPFSTVLYSKFKNGCRKHRHYMIRSYVRDRMLTNNHDCQR